ncbi:hypothetical protein AMTRI_Chr02g214920 [Amborella trichopoda]
MKGQQSCWIWSEAAPPWPSVLFGSLWKSLSLTPYFEKGTLSLSIILSKLSSFYFQNPSLYAIFITTSFSFYLSPKLSAFPNFQNERTIIVVFQNFRRASSSFYISPKSSSFPSFQNHRTVIVVGLYWISKANAMNLLHYFERSNIQNYVLLDEGWGFSYDFAKRGLPVFDSELL